MNEIDEREIVRRLHTLRSLAPPAERTTQVLNAARRQAGRATIGRWIMRGTIAAVVLIAIGVGAMILTQGAATAAAALLQVSQMSNGYNGWVHQRSGDERATDYAIIHFNNETGAWVSEEHEGGDLKLLMYLPAEKKEITYDSKSKEVKIGELNADFAQQWKAQIADSPLTVAQFVAQEPGAKVIESKDQGMTRFDVLFPPEPPGKVVRKIVYPRTAVIWADSKSKLIKKGQTSSDGEMTTFAYTYGEPEIRDLFDLGVPRETPVVDVRPPKEVLDLLERLQKRYETGFGDCVAVETETDVESDGKLDTTGGNMTLYARTGKAYLDARYQVGIRTDDAGKVRARYAPRPAGWPTPALDAAMASVKDRLASFYIVSDGADAWIYGRKIEPGQANSVKARTTLPGHLWPTRASIGLFGAECKAELMTEKSRPGLIGLKVEQMIMDGGGDETKRHKSVSFYWLDPTKDDLPVEKGWQNYTSAGDSVETEAHTTYTAYAKTEDGRWYPSAWKAVVKTTQRAVISTSTENRLQVWSGRTLPAEWFQDPVVKSRASQQKKDPVTSPSPR